VIEIVRESSGAREAPPSEAFERFLVSARPEWRNWQEGQVYNLFALRAIAPEERERAVAVLEARDATWREVEAPAKFVDGP
jgi:hypothetical protein